MKVSVIILTYNAIEYIDQCIKSILNQTFRDFKILVVDNASDDGTVEHIKRNYPEVTILKNFKNLGFAKGYNQGIKFWESEYVLAVNQDVILDPEFLEKILLQAEARPKYGSFAGKILKLEHGKEQEAVKPDIIDTVGISATKSRRFYDRGAGEKDKGQYDTAGDIFGVSGALALYRSEALAEVKIKNKKGKESYKFTTDFDYYEYFDEDFFMYKEDVDLSWRLQLAGWRCYYFPQAEAYHYRSAFGDAKFKNFSVFKNRRNKNKFVNQLSYRNHWLTIIKNDSVVNFVYHTPWILFYELKKFIYVLLLETGTLRSVWQCLKLMPNILYKRKQIEKIKKVYNKEIKKWFK